MEIINIIEEIGEYNRRLISFPIERGFVKQDIVNIAENMFWKLAVENGAEDTEENRDCSLDDGVWDDKQGCKLFLIWSE